MKKNIGFSLLEIMIALSIIGIIAALTLTNLRPYFITIHRQTAAQTLSKLAVAMEEYQLTHGSYLGATLDGLAVSEVKTDAHYEYSLSVDNSFYTLRADPISTQQSDTCGSLILNAVGEKTVSGTSAAARCW